MRVYLRWGVLCKALSLVWVGCALAGGRRVLGDGMAEEGNDKVVVCAQPHSQNLTAFQTARAVKESALIAAARNGDLEQVETLVEGGSDVDEMFDSITPLWIAAVFGREEVIDYLLKSGASTEVLGPGGLTPLLAAAEAGFESVIAALVNNGADIEAQDPRGCTALVLAVTGSHPRVVKVLITMGANLNARQEAGITPLYVAAYIGDLYLVKTLLHAEASANIPDITNATPLFIAAQHGHELVVHELLQANAWPDTSRADGATPLHAAAAGCHKGIAELLIGNNAKIEPVDIFHKTPVDYIKGEQCGSKYAYYTIEALLRPLFLAARQGDFWGASRLIENGRAVESFLASNGMTPLHIAASHVRVTVAQVLINNGAGRDIRSGSGERPIDVIGWERQADPRETSQLTQLLEIMEAVEENQETPPPSQNSTAEIVIQPEKDESTYDRVLIIACIMSAMVAVVLSIACFCVIHFYFQWRAEQKVGFPQTFQKDPPRDHNSLSSYQTAHMQKQGTNGLYGAYRNPIHSCGASTRSHRPPGSVYSSVYDDSVHPQSCGMLRNLKSPTGSHGQSIYEDPSISGSQYYPGSSGRPPLEDVEQDFHHQLKVDHASRGESPFPKRIPPRSISGRSVDGSSRQLTPTSEYCERSSHRSRFSAGVNREQGQWVSSKNQYPPGLDAYGTPNCPASPYRITPRGSEGAHRRQQSELHFPRGDPESSNRSYPRASSVPVGERRPLSRFQEHGSESGRKQSEIDIDSEDSIDSKLEKAIDSHEDSENNRR